MRPAGYYDREEKHEDATLPSLLRILVSAAPDLTQPFAGNIHMN